MMSEEEIVDSYENALTARRVAALMSCDERLSGNYELSDRHFIEFVYQTGATTVLEEILK